MVVGPQESSDEEALPNLAGVASGGFAGLQTGDIQSVAVWCSPVVLPARRVPWTVAARAQRYKQHSYFIFSVFILVAFVVAGLDGWRISGPHKNEPTIDRSSGVERKTRGRRC